MCFELDSKDVVVDFDLGRAACIRSSCPWAWMSFVGGEGEVRAYFPGRRGRWVLRIGRVGIDRRIPSLRLKGFAIGRAGRRFRWRGRMGRSFGGSRGLFGLWGGCWVGGRFGGLEVVGEVVEVVVIVGGGGFGG